MTRKEYHLHGDNIVECERVFSLIKAAHGTSYKCSGPFGSPATPRFALESQDCSLEFVFFPGFGRWEKDILEYVTAWPGTLREAADTIITVVQDGHEKPLAAVEYCSALDAGNNAWQRCGRAYSFAKAGIPYFYLTDIGGYELDGERRLKSRRYPNVAVPFSFVALSLRSEVVVLPVYECNPSADRSFKDHFGPALNEGSLEQLLFALLHGKSTREIEEVLEEKTIRFVELLQTRPDRQTEASDYFKAREAYGYLKQGKPFADFLTFGNSMAWKKSITIPLTPSASRFLQLGSQYGRGVTKSSLPICFVSATLRSPFAKEVISLYSDMTQDFAKWLAQKEDLVICWIAGFKPRGDDSRPDRGLVPLCRMLFGESIHVLSFVYGPGKPDMWRLLKTDPTGLMRKNGLWEAVLKLSNAVLIDSTTNKSLADRGYTQAHWEKLYGKSDPHIQCIRESPVQYGENDVDSALHNVIRHLMADCAFEGMCNPPGGDWSGVSMLNEHRTVEYRWLTLPRVSGLKTKRPDHVFQFFRFGIVPTIFTVESKETARAIEQEIGPRLARYLRELFKTPPNVGRPWPNGEWEPHEKGVIPVKMPIITGIAFLSNHGPEISAALDSAKADVALGLNFDKKKNICEFRGKARSRDGSAILEFIKSALSGQSSSYRFISV